MIVEKTNERGIFLINHQGFNYYIIIPVSANNMQFLLNITDNVNENMVKEIPLFNDKVIITPILDPQIINFLKSKQTNYDQAVYYFLNMVNNAYGLLKHNNMNVEMNKVIMFNDNSIYFDFYNYFVSKAAGRVDRSNGDLLKRNELSKMVQNVSNSVDVPINMNPYPNVDNIDNVNNNEEVKGMTKTLKKEPHGEPGFVSYVLLGVVIAVMSLIFLYMLI